jgi:poly(hydroxyalkanoate) depolymerase family esterase
MLHGCAQDAQALASVCQMNRVAAREGFFVLYPEQGRLSNPQGCWNWYATRNGQAQREADSILAMISQVCQSHKIDAKKIALAGLSAGAGMAAFLAARHPAHFQVVAMHSGIAPGVAQSQATALRAMQGRAAPPPPLPSPAQGVHLPALLVIHGSADHIVAARNGVEAALLWAHCEGARPGKPRTVQRGKRQPSTITEYKAAGRLVASHCLIHGLGHAWSGGAAGKSFSDPAGPDASRMIWAFASKQFAQAQSKRLKSRV